MTRPRTRPKSQPRIPGVIRQPCYAAVLSELDDALRAEARAGVSRSWITAWALARHLDIPLPRSLDYRREPWKHRNSNGSSS